MSIAYNTLNSLVPITQFNKGQASKIFDRLTNEKQLIVLKNNVPAAVILSPEEYIRLSEMAEDHYLALEAQNRMAKSSETVSFDDVMKNAGITQADLDGSVKKQVLKGIQKVSQNPLPDFQGGYGKPLGNLGGTNLSGLMKIKFRKIGIRVVYKVEIVGNVMKIIIISARSDNQVYLEAEVRRTKHGL